MKVLKDGRVRCRVKIAGTYLGVPFEWSDPEGSAGSQFISPLGDPSSWWWSYGNMSCDCNRWKYVGLHLDTAFEDLPCGEDIMIDAIIPLDYQGGELYLNETERHKRMTVEAKDAPLADYVCHKQVKAAKIDSIEVHCDLSVTIRSGDNTFKTGEHWATRVPLLETRQEIGRDLGYYVRYSDGFESWSPSTVFEDGYTEIPSE